MICSKCQHLNHAKASYCSKCGNNIVAADPVRNVDYNKHVKKVSVFFFVLLAYVAAVHLIDFGVSYLQTLLIDSLFAIIILIFYALDAKTLNHLFSFKGLKRPLLVKILVIAPVFAVLVSFLADLMNQSLFNGNQITYYNQFADSPAPITLSIISIGLFPAIFEEIAFRGILFNELNKITRIKSTILITAILFTMLHLSILSILWIFPIGLLFGYFRAKYRNIWYGIIGHFVYNSSIVLLEILMLANEY